ncbi:phenylacetate--CoA ligase family protein [Vibrio crassostreae]|uniref:phenylacetate--CoA ligase family protein n=1 Tax=Vibrio crassostreae TaxID=246167 RepID=UPI0010478DDA|nr:phenylacetate--CoA ligase family protein [Vibrio crassostreae]TCV26780.1 phenylacetate-CoA ligase [Vibrio crassostreae]
MFRKMVFYTFHLIFKIKILVDYYSLRNNEFKNSDEIIREQSKKVEKYIESKKFIYEGDFFNKVKLDKNDIKKINKIIAKPNLKIGRTGGSTGEPLVYYMSQYNFDLSFAITYRGWGRAGYKLGDKVAILAGGSLVNQNKTLRSRFTDYILNFERYSSYGMDDELMFSYYVDLNKKKPKFMRGYVSSIFEFAKFIDKKELTLSFDAIMTTAEMLSPYQREYIGKVFSCDVFNTYGLNDGGISAFECSLHNGFHIDTERAYLEVLNSQGDVVFDEVGTIVATSFQNGDGTPFIRYDTGDLGVVTKSACPCGSPYPLLKELKGRETDALEFNNKVIGSPVLTVLMSRVNVERYQFFQKSDTDLDIYISPSKDYSNKDEYFIIKSILDNLGEVNVNIKLTSDGIEFIKTKAGKHKIVIKENT